MNGICHLAMLCLYSYYHPACMLAQQEKHANALPYSTVLLPVSHGYTTETAIVLIPISLCAEIQPRLIFRKFSLQIV